MNHPVHFHLHQSARHWFKDLQFALGVAVAVGGAAVLLNEVVRLFV